MSKKNSGSKRDRRNAANKAAKVSSFKEVKAATAKANKAKAKAAKPAVLRTESTPVVITGFETPIKGDAPKPTNKPTNSEIALKVMSAASEPATGASVAAVAEEAAKLVEAIKLEAKPVEAKPAEAKVEAVVDTVIETAKVISENKNKAVEAAEGIVEDIVEIAEKIEGKTSKQSGSGCRGSVDEEVTPDGFFSKIKSGITNFFGKIKRFATVRKKSTIATVLTSVGIGVSSAILIPVTGVGAVFTGIGIAAAIVALVVIAASHIKAKDIAKEYVAATEGILAAATM